jgi:uncharacterized tellurite resistance protein B-like protein
MTDILDPIDLDLNQVRAIVQGMMRVAHADGAHERELVLIREFYESCRNEVKGLADFHDLEQAPFDVQLAAEVLATPSLQRSFLASCYLVAYADGQVSEGELAEIDKLVSELGIDAQLASETRDRIKDLLVMQLAHSANVEALQKISAGL